MLRYISDVLSNINFLAYMTATLIGIVMFAICLINWAHNDEDILTTLKHVLTHEFGKWIGIIFAISVLAMIFVPKNLYYLITGRF